MTYMSRRFLTPVLIAIAALASHPFQANAEESMQALTDRVFRLAEKQYAQLDAGLGEGRCPRTLDADGRLVTSDIGWWCSGFFPGSLWYIYEYTGNETIHALARKHTLKLEPLLEMDTDHDLGFMIDCSYGNALRITSDTASYRGVLLKAADKLAGRFNPAVGAIRSWDGEWTKRWDYPVIIDNMMNLQLLMDAYRINGKENLKEVATKHANTTANNHFRSDYSCWHLVDYSSADGSVKGKMTHQGHSDDSMWARGEAWAFYGFLMMYLKTGDEQYYMKATYIADLLLRTLPENGIPYWDFSCPDSYRDASAAAVMASAFIQIYEVSGRKAYLDMAVRQLRTLAGKEYLAKAGTNGGFLLKHSVGNLPGKSEIDVPLTYADYFFLEALARYRRATKHPRLFMDDREFASLKSQIGSNSNPALGLIHAQIMKDAGSFPSEPIVWELDESGKRILGKSRTALKQIFSDAYAYRFTGDGRYLQHAVNVIEQICAMPNWNGWHYLDVAELAAAAGIAYDWLYDGLPDRTRKKLVETLREYAFLEAFDFNKAWFYDRHHNWNQVCNGGLSIAALATREETGVIAGNIIRNAVRSGHRSIAEIYAPDGCYAEGPGYWTYGNSYQVLMNSGFDSALGDDFGLSRIKGFDRAADYVVSCYGATHRLFNYYDNSLKETPFMPVWYFAQRFDKPWLLADELNILERGEYDNGNFKQLPLIAGFAAKIDTRCIRRPAPGYYSGHGNNPIFTVRGDYSSSGTDWYLAVKGGKASNNHGHADAGSFVFDRDGIRWASDPGGASYTKSENTLKAKGGDFWKMNQESLRWTLYPMGNLWHNTLTVNGKLHRVDGKAEISGEYRDSCSTGATVDLGKVLSDDLDRAVRTFRLENGRTLTITDELTAKNDAEITFTLVTEATPTTTEGGIDLTAGDKAARLAAAGADVIYRIVESEDAAAAGLSVINIRYTVKAGTSSSVKVILE